MGNGPAKCWEASPEDTQCVVVCGDGLESAECKNDFATLDVDYDHEFREDPVKFSSLDPISVFGAVCRPEISLTAEQTSTEEQDISGDHTHMGDKTKGSPYRPQWTTAFPNEQLVGSKSKAPLVADAPMAVSEAAEPPGVDMIDGIEVLTPELIHSLLKDGTCVLFDVRGHDRAAGLIEGAVHVPAIAASMRESFAARLPELVQQYSSTRLIVFLCQFCKHRAPFCANLFRERTNAAGNTMQRVAIMKGGFRAWQKLGLPVKNECAPSEQAHMDAIARRQGMLVQSPL